MRHIGVADGLKLRFPARSKEFDEGVEVGLAVADMALGEAVILRTVAESTLEQIRSVADKFGYRMTTVGSDEMGIEIRLARADQRPQLKLVSLA